MPVEIGLNQSTAFEALTNDFPPDCQAEESQLLSLTENSMLCYNTYYVLLSLRSCLEVVTTLELSVLNMGHVGWNPFILKLGT